MLGVVSSAPVQTEPGTHDFKHAKYFGRLDMPLQVKPGSGYEFSLESYLDGTRLKMRNETCGRTTCFDATKNLYYDEANTILPAPSGAFAP